jgi:hypothetical protein
MQGIRDITHRMAIKSHSTGPWDYKAFDESKGGRCKACGGFEFELDETGHCHDDDCRRNRIVIALQKGEAMMTDKGVLVWTPGIKCVADAK